MRHFRWFSFSFLLAILASLPLRAELVVQFSGAGANPIAIAIPDFGGAPAQAGILTTIIRQDLERSGRFRIVDTQGVSLTEKSVIALPEWRARGADYLSAGSLSANAEGKLEARFRLFDSTRQSELAGAAFVTHPAQIRMAAHRIADVIYEKLTGEPGVFATRLAYVAKLGRDRFELQISDSDGQNAQVALRSKEPIMSPVWSPDGTRLAYVSFENKKPVIYVHTLATGARMVLANFKGSNSAPAWSPDGGRLAVVLSKDGGSQIFIVASDGQGARRISQTQGISTEPFFSPDGQWLYFSSDRGGSPQIYRMNLSGGNAERVTFEGSYNVSPRISQDGKTMAFITQRSGFRLAVMDLASRQVQTLTDSSKDESPSFAPNGRWLLFATEVSGRGVLSAVSLDGRVRQRLSVQTGDVRAPAWGPLMR